MARRIMTTRDFKTSSLGRQRASKNAAFQEKLRQMRLQLAPLVQLTTGAAHPAFPSTLLGFWLLTDEQLESMAHFYHQRTPSTWTDQYPCPVPWSSEAPLETKRRRLGRFIGLRGCESPFLEDCGGGGRPPGRLRTREIPLKD
jgi:hypothetical protein